MMMLRMMMMEMLALPMRCLLDTILDIRVVLDMRVVILRGSVVFLLRDVVRMICIFSFLSCLDTLFLYIRSCDHL